jgi:hypothetical protein
VSQKKGKNRKLVKLPPMNLDSLRRNRKTVAQEKRGT